MISADPGLYGQSDVPPAIAQDALTLVALNWAAARWTSITDIRRG